MLNKNFLLGCFIATLTACGGDSVDLGPHNPNFGEDPPPAEPTPAVDKTYVWDFAGEDAEAQVNDWRTGAELAPADANEGNDCDLETEISLHYQHPALQVKPTAGGWTEDFQDMCAMGFMSEPRAMNGGRIELSMYIPSFFTDQNPWNVDADNDGAGPEDDRFNFGLQILLEDESGNRAEAAGWINVYDLLGEKFNAEGYGYQQREPDPATGEVNGRWFDMAFNGANYAGADAGFDIGAVVGVGFRLTIRDTNVDLPWQENEQYVFVTNVVMEPDPTYVPLPESLLSPIDFEAEVFTNNTLAEGFSAGAGAGGTYAFDAPYLTAEYEAGLMGYLQIMGPDPAMDLSNLEEFQFAAYGAAGFGSTELKVSLCDCEDGVVVNVVEGEWTTFMLPLSDFPDTTMDAIRFTLNQDEGYVYLDNIGFDEVVVTGPALTTFALPIHTDDVFTQYWLDNANPEGAWSWGYESVDIASTAQAFAGSSSIEVIYGANGGGYKLAGDPLNATPLDISGYSEFQFSVYSEEPIGVTIEISDNWDNTFQANIPAGEWTTVVVPLVDLGSPAELFELAIQLNCDACTYPHAVYFDEMGFDPVAVPLVTVFELPIHVNDEFTQYWIDNANPTGEWSWGYDSVDIASAAQAYQGETSVEVVYAENFGGYKLAGDPLNATPLDISSYSEVQFSVYSEEAIGVTVEISGDWDNSYGVDIPAGEWTTVVIPLSDLGSPATLTEIGFQINCDTCSYPYAIYFDEMGFDGTEVPASEIFDFPILTDDMFSQFWLDNGNPTGEWSWGYDSVDIASTAQAYRDETSVEVVYAENFGGYKLAGDPLNATPLDISSYSEVQFSVYSEEAVGVTVEISGDWDNSYGVDIPAGEWTTVVVPLSDLGLPAMLTEIGFQINCDTCTYPYALYFDEMGFR